MATHATVWSGLLSSAESSLPVGTLVVLDGDTFKIATTANRTSYGRSVGVAITAADSTARSFEYQVAGVVPAATSGLAAGTESWVRASATGTFERCTPASGNDLVGKCNAAGDVTLSLGAWDSTNYAGGGGGGTTPTGTGFRHVTAGVEDGASAKVDLTTAADVTVPATGIVTSNGTVLSSFAPAANVQTFLTTPSSANLRAAVTDETGTGSLVFGTSPTFLTDTRYGTTPATFGETRLSNNWFTWARDFANGTNISILGLDATDTIVLGGGLGANADISVDAGATKTSTIRGQSVVLKGNAIQLGTTSGGVVDVGSGIGVVGLDDATSVPSSNPTAGIIFWSESSVLKYRQAGGTVITLDGSAAVGSITGLGAGVATWLATPSGANLASALTTALPATKGGTGLTSLGANVATWLGTPSSANLASAITDETGTGSLVFATSPTLVTPWISDSAGGQFYKFVVSDLSANRNVTLPGLLGDDVFVFEGHAQTLSGKTLTAGTLSTSVTLSTSGMTTTSNGNTKGTGYDKCPVNVQTTDATVTTLDSFTLGSNTGVSVAWQVTALKSDSSQAAIYSVFAGFRNAAGTVAQVSTTQITALEDDSSWACTIDNSTTTIRLRVTGKAATTIQWTAIMTRLDVIP